MTTTQIPKEHMAKLHACTDEDLDKVWHHNKKRADQDYAAGRIADAKRWYTYCDTAAGILEQRRNGPAPTPMATDPQVDYIVKLIVRRDTGDGFSGLVSSLHTNGKPNLDAIRGLTKTQASQVIDSLTGNY